MLHNSPYVTIPAGDAHAGIGASSVLRVARQSGRLDDPWVRDLVGEARMLHRTTEALQQRLGDGMRSGRHVRPVGRHRPPLHGRRVDPDQHHRLRDRRRRTAARGPTDDGAIADCGSDFLMRQVSTIGGGTTEMARNVISERVLGMPRERTLDRDVPFRDVPRGGQS